MEKETKVLQQAFVDGQPACLGLAMNLKTLARGPFQTQELKDDLQSINNDIAKFPQQFKLPQNQKDFADYKNEVNAIYKCVQTYNYRPLKKIGDEMNDHITSAYVDVLFGFDKDKSSVKD